MNYPSIAIGTAVISDKDYFEFIKELAEVNPNLEVIGKYDHK